MILSSAPPISDEEIPPEPSEPTAVPTNSLDAFPMSDEVRPASSKFETEVEVIFLKIVSVAVAPDSAELLGRYWLRPLTDFTILLTITLMTLMASEESDNPRSEDPEVIIKDMEKGIALEDEERALSITDRKQAIKTACQLASSGDIILVAGKGHETYQDIKGEKTHFSDVEVAHEFIKDLQK